MTLFMAVRRRNMLHVVLIEVSLIMNALVSMLQLEKNGGLLEYKPFSLNTLL